MAQHTPVEADPQEIERAQNMWHGFMQGTKWSIIAVVAILAFLGLVFISW